jgi:hypothetical protein
MEIPGQFSVEIDTESDERDDFICAARRQKGHERKRVSELMPYRSSAGTPRSSRATTRGRRELTRDLWRVPDRRVAAARPGGVLLTETHSRHGRPAKHRRPAGYPFSIALKIHARELRGKGQADCAEHGAKAHVDTLAIAPMLNL